MHNLPISTISEKQLTANRLNAQKSTGPKSPEAKAKCAQNARRHGITAQTTVMTEEDRAKHDAFCSKLVANLAPVGEMETFLASSAAEEAWRLNYVRAQCNNIVPAGLSDLGMIVDPGGPEMQSSLAAARVVRENAKTFELLSLYEQRIHRSFQKHYERLKTLQAERKAKHAADLDAARLLNQLAALKHLPWKPSEDGFEFSNAEVERYTDRYHRLQFAREEEKAYQWHTNLRVLPRAA